MPDEDSLLYYHLDLDDMESLYYEKGYSITFSFVDDCHIRRCTLVTQDCHQEEP